MYEQANSMANFDVRLFVEKGLKTKIASDTVAWFDRYPGPISVSVAQEDLELEQNAQGQIEFDKTFSCLNTLRLKAQASPDTFIFLLTKSPNELNWFATEDPECMRNAFGHVDDFSWITSAPGSAVNAHYILKSIFNALLSEAKVRWQEMWHMVPRGCFFDFCERKQDLDLKLRTADICADCLSIFQSVPIPDGVLSQTAAIMDGTRKLAINSGQFLKQDAVFDSWPFPVAITRHKAVQALTPLLRFVLLLNHFDSLVRYFYLAFTVEAGNQPNQEERPSLGWWVDQLAHTLKGERLFRDVVRIAQKEKVVALRNETIGHGWLTTTEDSFRDEADQLQETLSRIETELRPFFESHRLIISRQFELTEGKWVLGGEELIGSHILHPPFNLKLDSEPRSYGLMNKDEVYLTDTKMNTFKSMSPFIKSTNCPTCRHPRIMITDGGSQYIDVFIGHRVELTT